MTKLLERQSVTPRQPYYGFGPKRDGYDRKRTCFNCGSENHLIRNCPYESRQDGGYEGQYQNRRPYNRDDRGQYEDRSNQWPYSRGDKGQYQNQNAGKIEPAIVQSPTLVGNISDSKSENVLQRTIIGKCPVVTAKFGNTDVTCLVDSGSMVSSVTESFWL